MKFENYMKKATTLYDFTDKEKSRDNHIKYMINRTRRIFKYNNLPQTISERDLELFLQLGGSCCVSEVKGDLYALQGSLGGEPDAYYIPLNYTVANPYLNFNATLRRDKDCIFVPNDTLFMGLYPLFNKYATLLTENEISIKMVLKNSRVFNLLSASDDRTFNSALKYLQDIEDGKDGVIAENEFFNGIKSQEYSSASASNTIKNLIEFEQYTRASWFNEIGLNANYNMKRESLNSNESQLNDNMLRPLIDDMLLCRQEAIDKVNKLYGTNISVDFDSTWKVNDLEEDLNIELLQEQVKKQEEPTEDDYKKEEEDNNSNE